MTTIALIILHRYGDTICCTTTSMPYPGNVSLGQQRVNQVSYATTQFGATFACLSDDPLVNVAPLLGKQVTPLLMMLVRKGKVDTRAYHTCYRRAQSLDMLVPVLENSLY